MPHDQKLVRRAFAFLEGELMHFREINLCVLSIALPFIVQNAAFGQGTRDQQEACKPDVLRLCKEQIPNVDRIVTCLKGYEPQLNELCHDVLFKCVGAKKSQTKSKGTQGRSTN